LFFLRLPRHPSSTLFPYMTLFRSYSDRPRGAMWTPARQADLFRQAFVKLGIERPVVVGHSLGTLVALALALDHPDAVSVLVLLRSEEHTSELKSLAYLVCRLLLEK